MSRGPARSWLFAPGNDARRAAKALTLGADRVILDLEDAVALEAKAEARGRVRGLLEQLGTDAPPVYVRVNDIGSGLLDDDIRAVVGPGLAGIVLPKAETAAAMREADRLIAAAEAAAGLDAGSIDLVGLIETAAGLLRALEVAAACPRMAHLAFGAGDLCGDLGIPTTNRGAHVLQAKVQTVWASRAAGLGAPIDTVFFDLEDAAGLEADCAEAKALGFGGKLVIHPKQIEPVNRLLAPSDAEIAQAARIVAAFEAAEAAGTGAIRVDGKLVDCAMVKSARKILAVASALGRSGA